MSLVRLPQTRTSLDLIFLVEAGENGTDLVLRGAPHVVIAWAE